MDLIFDLTRRSRFTITCSVHPTADNNIDIQVARLVGELDHETDAEFGKTLEAQLRLDLGLPFGGETIVVLPREVVEPVALPACNTGF